MFLISSNTFVLSDEFSVLPVAGSGFFLYWKKGNKPYASCVAQAFTPV